MLRAELHPLGDGETETRATCGDIDVKAYAPVLAMCRALVAAGRDPMEPLEAYRGDVLCLKVRSIGEGAKLAIKRNGVGFYSESPRASRRALPVRFAASDVSRPTS